MAKFNDEPVVKPDNGSHIFVYAHRRG